MTTSIFWLVGFGNFAVAVAGAPKRIQAVDFDKSAVQRISMSPGLVSAVVFPCDLSEAVVGREEDLKAQVSPTTKRILILHLSSSAALPTNLIVRCTDSHDLFVFDIISSRKNHQDVFLVGAHHGGPALERKVRRQKNGEGTFLAMREKYDQELRSLIFKTSKKGREK